jgi:hypothetical protein
MLRKINIGGATRQGSVSACLDVSPWPVSARRIPQHD